jgi:hypothetical protein
MSKCDLNNSRLFVVRSSMPHLYRSILVKNKGYDFLKTLTYLQIGIIGFMVNQISAHYLANELDRLGVHFVRNDTITLPLRSLAPVELLVGLASSQEARLRLSLIPLLLWRPDYASAVQTAVQNLVMKPKIVLQCYYMAAYLQQQKHILRLKELGAPKIPLPDLFSISLGLSQTGTIDDQLISLAMIQARLSGEAINWFGTYAHAVESFFSHLERDKIWTT